MKCIVFEKNKPESIKEYNDLTKTNIPCLMLFHWKDCMQCHLFRPTWESIKNKLELNPNIGLIEVEYSDKDALPDTTMKKIMFFPTIFIIKKGKIIDSFNKIRTEENIIEFIMAYVNKSKKPKIDTKSKSIKQKPKVKTPKDKK